MKSGPFTLVGTSLTGKTIGIMGLGRIGFATAKRFKAFDTGKSLAEALLFAEHGENMLCTKIVLNVRNSFCT